MFQFLIVVYTDSTGKQTGSYQIQPGDPGYKYKLAGNRQGILSIADPGTYFPEKLKGKFKLDGKEIKLVFIKDEKGIVD